MAHADAADAADAVSFREAVVADLTAIMALEHESFPSDAWSENMMAEELASPHGRYLVVERGDDLLGYGGVRVVQGSHEGDIQTIAIAESARGLGLGRTLLRTLLDAGLDRGAREIFLEVRADNDVAHALYVSEGFVELGRRPRYYQPDDVDAIVMRRHLPPKENA